MVASSSACFNVLHSFAGGLPKCMFVEEPPMEAICPICHDVLNNPQCCSNTKCLEQHSFCNKCIRTWLNFQNSCPMDRQKLSISSLNPSIDVAKCLNSCVVRCPSVVEETSEDQRCTWTGHLGEVTMHQQTCEIIRGSFSTYISKTWGESSEKVLKLFGSEVVDQIEATRFIRTDHLKHDNNMYSGKIINSGLLTRFLEIVTSPQATDELNFEVLWVLTNIASGDTMHVKGLLSASALPIIVSFLQSQNMETAEQAAWALGNISGDCNEHRLLVLNSGAVPLLNKLSLKLYGFIQNKDHEEANLKKLATVSWTIGNFLRTKKFTSPIEFEALTAIISIFVDYDTINNPDILEFMQNILFCFSQISHSEKFVDEIIRLGATPKLVDLLGSSPNDKMRKTAIRVLSNILSGRHGQTQHLIEINVIPALMWCYNKGKTTKEVKGNILFAFSNIAAGTRGQIQTLQDAGIISMALKLLQSDQSDGAIEREAMFIVGNAIAGTLAHDQADKHGSLETWVESGIIQMMSKKLAKLQTDDKINKIIYETFEVIAKVDQAKKYFQIFKENNIVDIVSKIDHLSSKSKEFFRYIEV